jgi:hypothetical protein
MLERWRGRRTLLGWLVRKWDVWVIRRMMHKYAEESKASARTADHGGKNG